MNDVVKTPSATNATNAGAPSRLSRVTSGRIMRKPTVIVYGPEKVGKTRFAAGARKPIFLDFEQGSTLVDVARYCPTDWSDALGFLDDIETSQHEYESLVIDTVDWAERMMHASIAKTKGKANIAEIPYGVGADLAVDAWREVLAQLERIRDARNMTVILIGHASVRLFKNPEGDDFDRYELKLHKKSVGLIKEWPEYLLYAAWETHAVETDRKVRGVAGDPQLFSRHTAAYDAGARLKIPERLPIDWVAFAGAVSEAFNQEESK